MLAIALLPLAVLLVLSGCSLRALESQLVELEQRGTIEGTISNESGSATIIAMLFSDEPSQETLSNYRILHGRGAFEFFVRPGDYYLAAFEDVNSDFRYDRGEPLGFHGSPSPIAVRAKERLEHLTLKLSSNGRVPPGFTLDLSQNADSAVLIRLRANTGAVVDFDDDRIARRHARAGLWHPSDFLEYPGGGVFFLEPHDTSKTPVLFIHGTGGSPQDWRYLVENLDRTRFQPWLLFYPSALRLGLIGTKLHEVIEDLHARYDLDQLAVVAHSMGGLVARSFLNTHIAELEREYVTLFVSISTPWAGHSAAQFGAERVRSDILSWIDLVPGSSFLETLFETELPPTISYHLFFSYKGQSIWTDGNDDGVVSLASQLKPRAQSEAVRIHGFDNEHADILLAQEVSDEINRILRETMAPGFVGE